MSDETQDNRVICINPSISHTLTNNPNRKSHRLTVFCLLNGIIALVAFYLRDKFSFLFF